MRGIGIRGNGSRGNGSRGNGSRGNGGREIGIGIVGGGYMGKRHAAAMRAVGTVFGHSPRLEGQPLALHPRLVAVAASSRASAERYRAAFGFDRAAEDWRALVEDPAVEAVVVTTYPATHREIAEAALELGKPVLCEKPLADTLANARAMAAAAGRAGAVNMIGFNYRRTPATQLARRWIAEGRLGRVTSIRSAMLEDFLADGAAPDDPRSTGEAAGAMSELGSHGLDLAMALGGEIGSVMARVETIHPSRPGGEANDDRADVLLRYASGVSGALEVSRVALGAKMGYRYEVWGTEGSLRFDGEDQDALHLYRADDPEDARGFRRVMLGAAHPDAGAFNEGWGHGTGYGDQLVVEARDFLAAIDGGPPVDTDFAHGVRVAEITEAARRSSSEGRWMETR